MKPKVHLLATVAVFGTFLFMSALPGKSESTNPVSAKLEIYELSQHDAFAAQQVFAEGSKEERQTVLQKLREGTYAEGAKTIAVGQRSCVLGELSQVNSIKEYRYPTEYDLSDGFSCPHAFECRNIGWTMSLTISAADREDSYSVKTDISNVSLHGTSHFSASKADHPGSIVQPNFTNEEIKTQMQMVAGVPKLVSLYSPFKEDGVQEPDKAAANGGSKKEKAAKNVLRLVLLTVQPEK